MSDLTDEERRLLEEYTDGEYDYSEHTDGEYDYSHFEVYNDPERPRTKQANEGEEDFPAADRVHGIYLLRL